MEAEEPLDGANGVEATDHGPRPSTGAATTPGDTVFAYGYDLGGGGRWKVLEADDDGSLALDWFGYDDEAEDNFVWAAAERMLTVSGCTEPWDTQAYWDCALEAPSRLGVEIVRHGTEDEPMYALAAAVVPVLREQADGPDGAGGGPGRPRVDPAWDDTLRAVLSILQLTPAQGRPGWLLLARCE